MAQPWFTVRRNGLGWTPASAAGWAVVFGCLLLNLAVAAVFVWLIIHGVNPGAAVAFLLVSTGVLTIGCVVVAMRRSGG